MAQLIGALLSRTASPFPGRGTPGSSVAGLAAAVTVAVTVAGCSSGYGSAAGVAPGSASPSIAAPCIVPGTPFAQRIVHFPSADEHETVEAYLREPSPVAGDSSAAAADASSVGVVIDHQAQQTLCDSMGWADQFAAEGYLAIAPTLDDNDQLTETEGAVAYLRAHGAAKIVLLGASMGGTAVLQTAAEERPAVQAVISLSGPANFYPLDAAADAPKLTVPVYYCAGQLDAGFAAAETSMYDATTEKDKTLTLVPGTDLHGFDLLSTLLDPINAFIKAHV